MYNATDMIWAEAAVAKMYDKKETFKRPFVESFWNCLYYWADSYPWVQIFSHFSLGWTLMFLFLKNELSYFSEYVFLLEKNFVPYVF